MWGLADSFNKSHTNFHQDQRRLPINRFSVRIKYDIGLEPNLEYILGLLNVNGNITHSNQTHDYLVQPWAYITFKFKSRGHYYDSMISKVLLKYSLQKRCNIVSIIENYRIYHLSRQATWEPLATSRSLISKGLYQTPLTKLNSITYLLNYFTLRYYYISTYFLDGISAIWSKNTQQVKNKGKMKLHIAKYLNNCDPTPPLFTSLTIWLERLWRTSQIPWRATSRHKRGVRVVKWWKYTCHCFGMEVLKTSSSL